MYSPKQVLATEERFAARGLIHERMDVDLREGIIAANPPARVKLRRDRIKGSPTVPPEVARALEAPQTADTALERLLGDDDLLNVNYLLLALRAAAAVGRIRIRSANGRAVGYGTGFMVSSRLLLTNHHVLEDARTARASVVDMGFEDGEDGQPLSPSTFALEPDDLWLTDPHLDFSLVSVAQRSQAGAPLASYGWCRLFEEQGKILVREPVNIIQHPDGERKQIAFRANLVTDLLDDFIHYMTDTNPGSSGSPVFNEQWEVVALHHSGVPRRDDQDRILARDGSLWKEEMGDELIDWVANEGVRISRIVAAIRAARLDGVAADRRDELLSGARMLAPVVPPAPEAVIPATSVPATLPGVTALSLPGVEITIRVGTGGLLPGPAVPSVISAVSASPASEDDPDLGPALAALRSARAAKYYDEEADRLAQQTYYAGFQPGNKTETFQRLHDLLERTHTTRPAYRPSVHLYPAIDLQPNGMLRSIYSSLEFDPAEIIKEDLAIERRLSELAARLDADPALRPEAREALLEAAAPFNCEHVVPQSWFGKREPMRGDLHHLFTCEWGCNSFRGNTPYWDFPDFEEKDRDQCGRLVGDRFEPSAGKGQVARATLYFLVRYPDEVGDQAFEMQADRLAMLIGWHDAFPVTDHERHRNALIAGKQGNRNPFIDHPELAAHVSFREGVS